MNSDPIEVLRELRADIANEHEFGHNAADRERAKRLRLIDTAITTLSTPKSENTATKALEYVFGSYTDWERMVEEKLTPPWPLEHHVKAMGLLKDKPTAESSSDGWLQAGGLLYRLTEGHRPQNRDEINVTMVHGSRDPAHCVARAAEILAMLQSHPTAETQENWKQSAEKAEKWWGEVCDALSEADPDWMLDGPGGIESAVAMIHKLAARPAEAQAQGGEELWHMVAKLAAHVRPTCGELWAEAERLLNRTAPPSAPVGVEGAAELMRKMADYCDEVLAQQPASVGVPVDAVQEYLDARACYEAATRPPNSHARAPVLKHDDPDARRLRKARVALDNAIAQQPIACAQCDDDGEVASTDPYAETEPCPECKPDQQPAAVDGDWLVKARELYDRCSQFPENNPDGFMALLELRNHVHSILQEKQNEQ